MSDNVDKPDDQSSASSPETPEVEAEIVTDEDLVVDTIADSAGAFDDTENSGPPARKSTLTLGVIFFILFAVAAVVVFAVWRFQSGPSTPDLADAMPAESIIETSQTASDEKTLAMLDEILASAQPSAPPITTNEIDAGTTVEAEQGDRAESQPTDAEPSPDAQLPEPVAEDVILDALATESGVLSDDSAEFDGTDLQEAVSADDVAVMVPEAALDLDESDLSAEAETGESTLSDAISDAEQNNLADAAPVDRVGEDHEAMVEPDDAPIGEPLNADTGASLMEESIPNDTAIDNARTIETALAAQKIANEDVQEIKDSFGVEISRLEAALEAEREQNATQREQIEEMRRNFQAALAARDRSASQQITALNARLDKIENGNAVQGGRRAAAALALNNLRHVAEQGDTFANELDVLAAYLPQTGEIATLRRYAEVEIPKKGELEVGFLIAAREALAVAGQEKKTGLGEKLSARVSSLVSVRPAGPIEGDSAKAIISRAEAFIEAGDIPAGANELGALVDGPRAAMADWLALAQSRIAVDGAIASLGARLAAPVR